MSCSSSPCHLVLLLVFLSLVLSVILLPLSRLFLVVSGYLSFGSFLFLVLSLIVLPLVFHPLNIRSLILFFSYSFSSGTYAPGNLFSCSFSSSSFPCSLYDSSSFKSNYSGFSYFLFVLTLPVVLVVILFLVFFPSFDTSSSDFMFSNSCFPCYSCSSSPCLLILFFGFSFPSSLCEFSSSQSIFSLINFFS